MEWNTGVVVTRPVERSAECIAVQRNPDVLGASRVNRHASLILSTASVTLQVTT